MPPAAPANAAPVHRYRWRMQPGVLVVTVLALWVFAGIVLSMPVARDLPRGWGLVVIGIGLAALGLRMLLLAGAALDPPDVLLLYRDRCEFRISNVRGSMGWGRRDRTIRFADVGGVESWTLRTRYGTFEYLRFRLLPRGAGTAAGHVDIPIHHVDVEPRELLARINALLFPATATHAPRRLPRPLVRR